MNSYLDALARWEQLSDAIARLRDEERALREHLFGATFPNPREGTNEFVLPDGRSVTGTYALTRTVDQDRAREVCDYFRDHAAYFRKDADALLPLYEKTEIALDLRKYRTLPADCAERYAVQYCVTEKPKLPTLSVIYPGM